MATEAHRVYRDIRFEIIITDDDDYIQEDINYEITELKKLSIKDLIKSKKYEIVSDETTSDFIESWDSEDSE